MKLFDSQRRSLALGKKLGSGGEGNVFELPQSPERVAKIYHQPLSPEGRAKQEALIALSAPEILKTVTLPIGLITNERGVAVGIEMQRLKSEKDLHFLYNPLDRKRKFPDATYQYLATVARNCAAAFDAVHQTGLVIGDVNQNNVLFDPRSAQIRLVDGDSYQVTRNGKTYRCRVGVDHFTPPELQGLRLSDVDRTPNHDCFGLAVLLFHILFMGRHPFVGKYLGTGDQPSIADNIKAFRFAYSPSSRSFQMEPPTHALFLSEVDPAIANLFVRAFAREAATVARRPTAREWGEALDSFCSKIRTCSVDRFHWHYQHAPCPWCRIEKANGPIYFIGATSVETQSLVAVDVDSLWHSVASVSLPVVRLPSAHRAAASIQVSTLTTQAGSSGHLVPLFLASTYCAAIVLGVSPLQPVLLLLSLPFVVVSCVLWFLPRSDDQLLRLRRQCEDDIKQLESKRRTVLQQQETVVKERTAAFQRKREELSHYRDGLLRLSEMYQTELDKLKSSAEEQQRKAWLSKHRIKAGTIDGIGQQRVTTLAYYGIASAADVSSAQTIFESVPGIGMALASRIVAWKAAVERGFRFDPAKGIPQHVLAELIAKYRHRQSEYANALTTGPFLLRSLSQSLLDSVAPLLKELSDVETGLSQKRANLSEIEKHRNAQARIRFPLAQIVLAATLALVLLTARAGFRGNQSIGHPMPESAPDGIPIIAGDTSGEADSVRRYASRLWTDKSGKFSVSASLVICSSEDVVLRYHSGDVRRISRSSLSKKDEDYLKSIEVRTWTSTDGRFSRRAKLLNVEQNYVRLEAADPNKTRLRIDISKLSDVDKELILALRSAKAP